MKAVDISVPTKVLGSKKVLMPREKGLTRDNMTRQLYCREDEKHPRDGAGRVSPVLSVPEVHVHNKLGYVGRKLYSMVLEKKWASKFLKKLADGSIKNDKLPPFDEEDVDCVLRMVCSELGYDYEKMKVIDPDQPFRLNLFESLIKEFDDPDSELIPELRKGVHMGDDERISDPGL